MGQSGLNFCNKYATTKLSLPSHRVNLSIKELTICQLKDLEVETSQAYTIKRGEWTLEKYGLDANWSIKLEFGKSIAVWHVATDICYRSEPKSSKSVPNKVETTKILSYYTMHLLLFCPTLSFCNNNENFTQAYPNVEKFFEEAQFNGEKLATSLMEKQDKWEIMSNIWVEMLCYAVSCCLVNHHVQELRHGGQFLTRLAST
ncbi:hypothetical protein CsSME_00012096 [Camellia sinensis var. sinensis]